ncbi:TetR/AcrR family transcriptional regulator [Chloroflexales bacterium ZM16-3]|nr:TetR/AcrR family transcriptional regulator [Chloroflexales bacterium ZM16-3]
MPRGFSEQERATIRAGLQARARELLASYGMRKISVEDLTAGAGISKGAFYLFYGSKEELFFEVIQQFEAEYQAALLGALGPPDSPPRERVRAFIERAMTLWRSHPLFRHFGQADLELLTRRLPPEKMAEGLRSDDAFAVRLIAAWAADGVEIHVSPQLLAGLLRALFFVGLHADELDPQVAPQVIERMIAMLANDIA